MPAYKLCYFHSRGFAEMSRLLLADAGVAYEDVRYTSEEWPQHKPDMLFNQMPVLFVDGEQIAHSRAALRYLAREFNFDGGDSLTAAKVDMWIEVIIETLLKFPIGEKDEKKQKEQSEVVFKEHFIPRLVQISKIVEANKGSYLFGEKPTAADFAIYSVVDMIRKKSGTEVFLEGAPKVKVMMTALENRPNIAKWIKERPVTEN